jgi:hypothetical protein
VRSESADEVNHKADRGQHAKQWQREANQQSGRAAGQHDS